jgi:excisionase family DNA binding protein
MEENVNELLSVKQVAEYLQLKRDTIYAWARQGKIPVIRVGGILRFRRKDIEAWLTEHTNADAQESTEEEAVE